MPPPRGRGERFDPGLAARAVEAARLALDLAVAGPPLVERAPRGVRVDVPILYEGMALDRVHYDPELGAPSPKGRPVEAPWRPGLEEEARRRVEASLREADVLPGAEYRAPEEAWAVPVAWRSMIIAWIRVSWDAKWILGDPGLTAEVVRRARGP